MQQLSYTCSTYQGDHLDHEPLRFLVGRDYLGIHYPPVDHYHLFEGEEWDEAKR